MSSLIDGPIDVEPSDSTPDPSPNNIKDGLQVEEEWAEVETTGVSIHVKTQFLIQKKKL